MFPWPETGKLSLPLFCRTSPDPIRPETEPPTVRPSAAINLDIGDISGGRARAVRNGAGLGGTAGLGLHRHSIGAGHGGLEGEGAVSWTVRSSAPLSSRTIPVPRRPITVPPIVKLEGEPPLPTLPPQPTATCRCRHR